MVRRPLLRSSHRRCHPAGGTQEGSDTSRITGGLRPSPDTTWHSRSPIHAAGNNMQGKDDGFPPLSSGGKDYRSLKREASPRKSTASSPIKTEGKARWKDAEVRPHRENAVGWWPYGPKHPQPPRPYGYGRPPDPSRHTTVHGHATPHAYWGPHFCTGSLFLTWSPPRPQ